VGPAAVFNGGQQCRSFTARDVVHIAVKYLKCNLVAAADLVAVFDGGQHCKPQFFEAALPALAAPGVALVATAPAFSGIPDAADVFDLVRASEAVMSVGQYHQEHVVK